MLQENALFGCSLKACKLDRADIIINCLSQSSRDLAAIWSEGRQSLFLTSVQGLIPSLTRWKTPELTQGQFLAFQLFGISQKWVKGNDFKGNKYIFI